MATARIGIIADTTLQGHLLSTAVRGQGYEVAVNTDPGQLDKKWFENGRVDLWVVDLSQEDKWGDFLDHLLEDAPVPILFSDSQAPARNSPKYPRWERRLLTKMLDFVDKPMVVEKLDELAPTKPSINIPVPKEFKALPRGDAPQRVCVLGASLGGPAAVKPFLDCLPPELPMAFILAQHIDESFLDTLSKVLCRDNDFDCEVGYEGTRLQHGKVLIMPTEYAVGFTETGVVVNTGQEWEGPYAPSIDQVIGGVAHTYRERSAAILFSGMGNDGSIAAPQMKAAGGFVWAQTAKTCACSSQPDSVRETGCVDYSGSPEELALALVERVRQSLRQVAS